MTRLLLNNIINLRVVSKYFFWHWKSVTKIIQWNYI